MDPTPLARALEIARRLPPTLRADWQDTNHFALHAPDEPSWLCLTGASTHDTTEYRQRVGAVLDAAAVLPDLLATWTADHPDAAMVLGLTHAMMDKLARARAKGRKNWHDPAACSAPLLHDLLREHVVKDNLDMVDVANLAGMLWVRINTVPGDREAVLAHLTMRGKGFFPASGVPDTDALTPREQDAALGDALGLCVWVRGGSLEHPVRVLVPLEEVADREPAAYAVERATDWNKAPGYHASRDVCALAEAVVERLGLTEPYLARLVVESQNEQSRSAHAAVALAPPAARVRAMLAALSEVAR